MSVSSEQKEALIDELFVTKRKAHKAYIVLRFQGREEDAARVKDRADQLAKKIDRLLSRLMTDWCASAEEGIASLRKANHDLQRAIRQIKNGVAVTTRVVKVLGVLDEVIGWAGKLVT
ncbi:MAG: hypothetical protein GXP47_03485 [Acidobacteria bacterium]|nr:hypothetical protein [Acidobacteriota bacterium]